MLRCNILIGNYLATVIVLDILSGSVAQIEGLAAVYGTRIVWIRFVHNDQVLIVVEAFIYY